MKKVAIFIDHENLVNTFHPAIRENYNIDVLLNRAKEEGRVIVAKVYVPFGPDSKGRNRYLFTFYDHGIEPVYTPSYSTGKSGPLKSLGDPMLTCDAMEILYERPAVNVFILCSGDKDIIPLLRKIVEHGKDVVVIGVAEATARALVDECKRLNVPLEDYGVLHQPILAHRVIRGGRP